MVAVTDRSWMPAVLGDGGDAGGQAADQADQHDLDRRGAIVLGGEALGVIGVELIGGPVLLLGAEAGEAGDGGAAVGAVAPGAAGPPGELGGFGRGGQRLARAEQGLDVHAVVDGTVGDGHRCLLDFDGIGWPVIPGARPGPGTTGSETRPRRTRPSPCAQASSAKS